MGNPQKIKFHSISDFLGHLPEDELEIVEILREIVLESIPDVKEKLSYNVPFYSRYSRICYIWPASVPWGGVEEGVCFGLVRGNQLSTVTVGDSKQISKQIFKRLKDIDVEVLKEQIYEAVVIDEAVAEEKKRKKK